MWDTTTPNPLRLKIPLDGPQMFRCKLLEASISNRAGREHNAVDGLFTRSSIMTETVSYTVAPATNGQSVQLSSSAVDLRMTFSTSHNRSMFIRMTFDTAKSHMFCVALL